MRESIVTAAFEASDTPNPWHFVAQQPWDSLVPALEAAIARIHAIRKQLFDKLVALVQAQGMPNEITQAMGQIPAKDLDEVGPPVAIILAAGYCVVSDLAPTPSPAVESSVFTTEPIALLREMLREAWHEFRAALRALCPAVGDLDFDFVLSPSSIVAFIRRKVGDAPFLSTFVEQLTSRRFPPSSTTEGERAESAMQFAMLLVDLDPLTELREVLATTEDECAWAHPDNREDNAAQCLYLDGLARLRMTGAAKLSDFESDDGDPVLKLLKDPERRNRLRKLVLEALGAHLVIDSVSVGGQAQWRLSTEAPEDAVEAAYTRKAADFHRRASLLAERSDGIHAYVGMLAAILASDQPLVFIDEPEAFLHPPIVRKFARQIGQLARERSVQFFIATHSPDLLAASMSSGTSVAIVRLTYDQQRATARMLDAASLRRLALEPLLRAESSLSALFQHGAVVAEAAADRVVYDEVNHRLVAFEQTGVESCAFLNAQNWQTEADMIEPLRRMGVAAAAIVDADVLFADDLPKFLKAAQVPSPVAQGIHATRGTLRHDVRKRLANNDAPLKREVIPKLDKAEREAFEHLCRSLADYGVFVVPVGELEDWLTPLGLKPTKNKSYWLEQALERLGWDPDSDTYARPAEGDVWQFMRDVAKWIRNPDRKGTSPRAG